MPQDGSKNYYYPPGTRGIPDETIESATYNNFLDDLVDHDLNTARPVHRGGTGAITPDKALLNLGAEKAAQEVTNYNTHVWLPGSFRSAASATAGPVDGHAFAGIVYIGEPLIDPPTNANVIVSARDMNDTVVPGRVYVREKKPTVPVPAGEWGAWTTVGASTLPFPPGEGFDATTILEAFQELDDEKVSKSGDTMTGLLALSGGPVDLLHAATKQYVDTSFEVSTGGVKRNRIVNGAMQIYQIWGIPSASTANLFYPADQWHAFFTAPAGTVSLELYPSLTPNGSNNRLRASVTSAQSSLSAGSHWTFRTILEGYSVSDFMYGTPFAKPCILRFGWRSPAGTYSIRIMNVFSDRSYVQTFTIAAGQANIDTEQTFVIPGDTTGGWKVNHEQGMYIDFVVACGTTKQGTTGWQAGNFMATAANTNGLATASTTFHLFDVGLYLVVGAAPVWEMPNYAYELAQCKRYYQASFTLGGAALASGMVLTATQAMFAFKFSSPMRAVPTLILSSLGNLSVLSGALTRTPTVLNAIDTTTETANLFATTSTGLTAGYGAILQAILPTNGYPAISFDARLT